MTAGQLPSHPRMSLAEVLEVFAAGTELPLRFCAYDGSSTGPADAPLSLELRTPRGASYLLTAPGDLGLARAYVAGDLDVTGVHPGDPYELLRTLATELDLKRPPARVLLDVLRSVGIERLRPVAPPPQEMLPRWRRLAEGLRHSRRRDAEVIHHHERIAQSP